MKNSVILRAAPSNKRHKRYSISVKANHGTKHVIL